MIGFIWTDRAGVKHQLDGPEKIELEIDNIEKQVDAALPNLNSNNSEVVAQARELVRGHISRLTELGQDVTRWNESVASAIMSAANELAKAIDELPEILADIHIIRDLHVEQMELLNEMGENQSALDLQLNGPITDFQRAAITACIRSNKISADATRGEAMEWLNQDPRFSRKYHREGGWFEWTNEHGATFWLVDPLVIEFLIADLKDELEEDRQLLSQHEDIMSLSRNFYNIREKFDRLNVLLGDIERFTIESERKEANSWREFSQDWEKNRNTP